VFSEFLIVAIPLQIRNSHERWGLIRGKTDNRKERSEKGKEERRKKNYIMKADSSQLTLN